MEDDPSDFPLDVHDLTVAYESRPVVWNVDLVVKSSQLMAIVGPNGAGKSTLLKAILGVLKPASGHVRIFGKPLKSQKQLVGYLPQRGSVDWDFPITVFETVLMGTYGRLRWFQRPGGGERDLAMHCLESVGMADFSSRQIGRLSGGQQQRVFLARALAQQAEIYFMDEPMAGVDLATERILFEQLGELRDQGKTIIVVHHDLDSVPQHFDTVALLNRRLVAYGSVDEVFHDENLRRTYGTRLDILEIAGNAIQAGRRSE